MNLSDLIIIYLALGAPLGVYFYINNRKLLNSTKLWLETVFIFIFWIPFLLKLVKSKKNFIQRLFRTSIANKDTEKEIYSIIKNIEVILKQSSLDISIYEFREIFERYVGLTLAKDNHNNDGLANDDFFKISNHKNISLAKICLTRRNRKHLTFHQTKARQDFLKLITNLFKSIEDKKILREETIGFVKLLNDSEAQNALSKIFNDFQQTHKVINVNITEEKQWKTDTHKPLEDNQIPIRLRAMQATVGNLHKKD